jgi:hypothetical protein
VADYKPKHWAELAKLLEKLRFLKLPKRPMNAIEHRESGEAAEKQREVHAPEPRAAGDPGLIAGRRRDF